jgi:hypothetical protein
VTKWQGTWRLRGYPVNASLAVEDKEEPLPGKDVAAAYVSRRGYWTGPDARRHPISMIVPKDEPDHFLVVGAPGITAVVGRRLESGKGVLAATLEEGKEGWPLDKLDQDTLSGLLGGTLMRNPDKCFGVCLVPTGK